MEMRLTGGAAAVVWGTALVLYGIAAPWYLTSASGTAVAAAYPLVLVFVAVIVLASAGALTLPAGRGAIGRPFDAQRHVYYEFAFGAGIGILGAAVVPFGLHNLGIASTMGILGVLVCAIALFLD
jgi:hypothetical protein